MNRTNIFQHLLVGLDDRELEDLGSAVYQERTTRLQTRISQGEFTAPTPAEKELWRLGNRLDAIKAYRDRCATTLYESKAVLEQLGNLS